MGINLSIVLILVVFGGSSLGQLFTYSGAVCANYLLLIMPSYLFLVAFDEKNENISSENSAETQTTTTSGKAILSIHDTTQSEEKIGLKHGVSFQSEQTPKIQPTQKIHINPYRKLFCKILGIFGILFLVFTVILEIYKGTKSAPEVETKNPVEESSST